MEAIKVGIREFRSDLAEYIADGAPVAVTRHGRTVGYFIPANDHDQADLLALKKASKTLDKLLKTREVNVEEVITEFRAARRKQIPISKKNKSKLDEQ